MEVPGYNHSCFQSCRRQDVFRLERTASESWNSNCSCLETEVIGKVCTERGNAWELLVSATKMKSD